MASTLFVPHGAQTPGWRRVGVNLPWHATREITSWFAPENDSRGRRPDVAAALPRTRAERPMFIVGGSALDLEEIGEIVERVQEKNNRTAPTESDRKERIHNWRMAVHDALQRRMAAHRRNPISDPAPNYTRVVKGLHAVWPDGKAF